MPETTNPDNFIHAFRTLFGMPPDKGDTPACGATLTDAYDFRGKRPTCPTCDALVEAESAKR
jgi:hypothetical protein